MWCWCARWDGRTGRPRTAECTAPPTAARRGPACCSSIPTRAARTSPSIRATRTRCSPGCGSSRSRRGTSRAAGPGGGRGGRPAAGRRGNETDGQGRPTRGRTSMRIVLPIAKMYHVHVDTRARYFVYGNRQDGSSYRMPSRGLGDGISEGAWQHVGGCESGFGIPDTVDNATVWSGCYDGGLEVYDVRTGHARNVRVWPEAGYGWRPADLKYRWNWTFPIMISPHDHRRVYVGSQYLHVTSDGGASWKVVSPDLTRNDTSHQQSSGGVTTDNLMTFDGATLFALAESPVQAGVIWAGSNDGLVHVTRDGATTWTDVTGNLPKLAPWGKISNIEPSRFDAGTAYISVDLHELDDLDPYIFKTTDFGRSWKRISEGLPRSPLGFVHVVREDPERRGRLCPGPPSGGGVTLQHGGGPVA